MITFGLSVPVKTGVDFLPSALRSLSNQNVPLNVALLDASGDDHVRALALQYQGIIRHRRHAAADEGQAAAIQEGWQSVDGDVLGWLNADDCLIPNALDTVAAIFERRKDIDVVYGHAVYVRENGEFQSYFPSLSRDLSALRRGNIICQPACFARRAAIERVGGLDVTLQFTMDWDLWLRLREAGCNFQATEEPLAVVNNRGATKTNAGGSRRYAEIDRILRRYGGTRSRVMGLIGHRRTDSTVTKGLTGRVAEAAMRLAGRFRGRNRAPPVLGIEPESNRVTGRCRIPMVWYREPGPKTVRIAIEGPSDHCLAFCNGSPLDLRPERTKKSWLAPIAHSETGLYSFEVESDGTWRLSKLKLFG